MKVIINGDLNRSYAQTLCLIFFPGAKFAQNEEITPDTPVVTYSVAITDGKAVAHVEIQNGDDHTVGDYSVDVSAWETEQKAIRLACGTAFLNAGSVMFDSFPSWGILTGVRPAKVAMTILEKGIGRQKTVDALMRDYFVTPKKASLVTDVALHEMKILNRYGKDCCSLYISIPFCPTRCAYCSFVSYSTKRLLSLIPAYLDRLCMDIDRIFKVIRDAGKQLVTVYIGGGTPTILDARQLDRLLSKINENTDVSSLLEFTVEAGRPDTITPEKLSVCHAHGVNRISINPQTLSDDVLAAIGRKHTAADFFRAFEMAQNSGIPHINTDLIAGLPGDNFNTFSSTVDRIAALAPDNITVHTFCAKKSAAILSSGARIYSRTGGDTGKCVDYSQLQARANGYVPYYLYRQKNAIGNFENVGFAKPGTEGLYNIFIMEEIHSIYAVGAGAVTKLVDREQNKIARYFMPKYPYEYLNMTEIEIDKAFQAVTHFEGGIGFYGQSENGEEGETT